VKFKDFLNGRIVMGNLPEWKNMENDLIVMCDLLKWKKKSSLIVIGDLLDGRMVSL
jgi:hypothetical protein